MKDPQKSRFSYKQYSDIGFSIMMQLFGHKVEYAESNITKDGVEENGRMWEKTVEELNERRMRICRDTLT